MPRLLCALEPLNSFIFALKAFMSTMKRAQASDKEALSARTCKAQPQKNDLLVAISPLWPKLLKDLLF